ncbi:MAG: nickel-dependent lactate racemase [Desulfohalobiaceae bacterium]|nr:nickel-dependent lactate racemase [Desulfohalobiaceae bacterium]
MPVVNIPFGGQDTPLGIPEENLAEVLTPKTMEQVHDLRGRIEQSLDQPLGQPALECRVGSDDRVLLVCDDNTRLTPAAQIIPPILNRLNRAGIPDRHIACIMALGTHRYMTAAEMTAKVGAEVMQRIKVFNHEWRNPEILVDLGRTDHGTPIQVNQAAVQADVVIGLGAIVPHHIPGYSGSSKIIQPGICGARTTAATHMLSCRFGGDSFLGLVDNPVREDMDHMADRVGMETVFNVVMDSRGQVIGVFFGEMRAAFAAGVNLARQAYGVEYHEIPDIVLTNSYPCDLDFWQAHKSQYPAQRMVKAGGTIIVATPAPEGVSPVHTDLLDYTGWSSEEIKEAYAQNRLTNGVAAALAVAWAMVREKASVIMYSPGISARDKARLGHTHAPSLDWAIQKALERQGPKARISVLTHAPDMLPIYSR